MPNVLNLPEVLTYRPVEGVYILFPGQALLRGGPVAQPLLGLKRSRPNKGQVWPRSEFPRDRFIP
jgi:hypothetical protein